MTFATPSYLYFLLVVPLLGALVVVEERRREQRLATLGEQRLLRRLSHGSSRRRRRLPRALGLAGLVFLIIGLAGPRYGERTELLPHRGLDVVFAIDVSASMRARDVRPDRLARTKAELSLLLDKLRQNRVGIVAFAGTAFVQCPLTTDLEAARLFLHSLDPAVVPQGGTDLAAGLLTARNLFDAEAEGDPAAREAGRLLVVVTDGEDHVGRAVDAAAALREASVEVIILGVGGAAGEPIPEFDGAGNVVSYKRDRRGDTVMTRLSWPVVEELARASGGVAVEVMGTTDFGAGVIEARLTQLSRRDFEARVKRVEIDRASVPLGLAFLFLVMGLLLSEGRRGSARGSLAAVPASLHATILAAVVLVGGDAEAAEGWLERVEPSLEEGAEALSRGDFERAITQFRGARTDGSDEKAMVEYDVGSALYAQARRTAEATEQRTDPSAGSPPVDEAIMREAAKAYARAYGLAKDADLRSSAALAEGNAYARSGELARAVEAYRRSLVASADNRDARENLRTTLRALASPPPPSPQEQQQNGENEEREDQGEEPQGDEQGGEQPREEGAQQGTQERDRSAPQDANSEKSDDGEADGRDETVKEGQDESSRSGEGQEQASGVQPDPSDSKSQGDEASKPREGQSRGSEERRRQDAKRLLDQLRSRERTLQPWTMQTENRSRAKPVEKDW